MVLFNHATREMTAKIVYYGPGLCGKTTNLLVIFDKLDPKTKGKMLSLATKTDRTLFFDLLPVDIGKVGNFNLKIQLYTVPGQVFYNETRKLVLKGADSIVFVADSQPTMIESNRESFANLLENLEQNQIDPNDVPIVIQFNKRDLPGVLPVEDLQSALGLDGYPYAEASALRGDGVMETFKLVTKITAKHLIARLSGKSAFDSKKSAVKKASSKISDSGLVPATAEPMDLVPDPPAGQTANPFVDSLPFPQGPVDEAYEHAEEVSLEQLLEGRDRPATMSGNVPLPSFDSEEDDVEELDAADIIEDELPVEVVDFPSESFGGSFSEPVEETALDVAPMEIEEIPPTLDELLDPPNSDARVAALEAEVRELREEISTLRSEHSNLLRSISMAVADVARLVEQ